MPLKVTPREKKTSRQDMGSEQKEAIFLERKDSLKPLAQVIGTYLDASKR